MTVLPSPEENEERDKVANEQADENAAAREEAASVIDDVVARLEALSKDLRKRKAYPIAGMIDRDRQRLENRVDKLKSG